MRNHIIFILCIVLSFSCMKRKYNFRNFDNSKGNPIIGLPMINSSIAISKLFADTDSNEFLKVDDNNLMYISYQKELTTIKSSELLDTLSGFSTAESQTIGSLELESFSTTANLVLGTIVNDMSDPIKTTLKESNGENIIWYGFTNQPINDISLGTYSSFSFLEFSEGQLQLTITNNWPFDLRNLQIRIANDGLGDAALGTFTFVELKSGETETQYATLAGKLMNNRIQAHILNMESPSSAPDEIYNDLSSQLDLTIEGVDLEIIAGQAEMKAQEVFSDTVAAEIEMLNGEILDIVELSEGKLSLTVEMTVQQRIQIDLFIPELVSGYDEVFNKQIIIQPEADHITVVNNEFNLQGYFINMNNTADTNTLHPQVKVTALGGSSITFDSLQYFNITNEIKDLKIRYAQGFLGQSSIAMDVEPVELDFSTDIIPGDLRFHTPEFTLSFSNSFGLPIELDLAGLSALVEGDTANFTGSVIDSVQDLSYPTLSDVGDSMQTVININSENSNIRDILAGNPSGIFPNVSVNINPDGYTDRNFVYHNNQLSAALDVNIPFYCTLANLSIQDTMDASNLASSISPFAPATLKIDLSNSFPVEILLDLVFTDVDYEPIEIIKVGEESKIPHGKVDANGNVTSPSTLETEIVVDEDVAANIANATYLILDIKVQSPEEGSVPVKFYTDSQLDVVLGILSQLKIF